MEELLAKRFLLQIFGFWIFINLALLKETVSHAKNSRSSLLPRAHGF